MYSYGSSNQWINQTGSLSDTGYSYLLLCLLTNVNNIVFLLFKQNGVKVFSNLVYLVMKDNRFSKDEPQEAETEWLKKTRTNLDEILGKIMNNPELHWKVKLELISMIDLLINNCSVTLEPSLTLLIKKLVQFTADDNVEVSRKAKEVVESLSLSQLNFDTAVRQNLYDIVTCLPRIITQGS